MPLASGIAAVTGALRTRLDRSANAVLPGTSVSVRPPDRARAQPGSNQINLFLYGTRPNAAWRNMRPMTPILALDLHYLLSVYGANDDDPEPTSHLLLEAAMRALHERPVLGADELAGGVQDAPPYMQEERIAVSHQPLSLDEMSKLWTVCQTPYRLSIAFEASVLLIGQDAGGVPRP